MNGLVITGTIFPHKEIHKATWTSPNGRTKNQIDHTMIAKEYRSSVMDTVVRRGADVRGDHYLVETRLKLKLKRNPREMKGRTTLNTQKLADKEMLIKYNIEVRNRFQALTELDEENADHMNNRMESIYAGAAKDVLGIAKRTSKPWLRDGTWKKVEERRQLKLKLGSTRSERVKKRIKEEYKGKDQEVKRSAREDKRYWINEMADIDERAAENGRAGEQHRIVKTLTGEKKLRTSTVVNDKNGKPTNEQSERLKIWKEHFDTVLNKEPPVRPIEPHEIETRQNDREFDLGAFQPTEVKNAIKSTKSGKAAGHDSVVVELLKTDLEERAKELTKLFNKVKEEGVAPKSWSKGLIYSKGTQEG